MIKNYKILFIPLLLFCLVTPLGVMAYSETTSGGSLVATVKPKEPGADEIVKVNLNGYGYELDSSLVVWYVNNKEVERGIGLKSYTFKTGSLGETTIVTIAVKTRAGRVIAKKLVFTSADVDILWEADTYTPYFYPGASLATSGSNIEVVAIPQILDSKGNLIPSSRLIFTWRKDYKNLVNESGYGKDSLSFRAGVSPSDHNLEVTVTSPNSVITANKKVTIPIGNPEVVVYPYKPLTGIDSSHAILSSYLPTESDISLKAEPYYFPTGEVTRDNLVFNWTINNDKNITSIADKGLLNLTLDKNREGIANINLNVFPLLNNNQQARENFKILFEDNSFFGF